MNINLSLFSLHLAFSSINLSSYSSNLPTKLQHSYFPSLQHSFIQPLINSEISLNQQTISRRKITKRREFIEEELYAVIECRFYDISSDSRGAAIYVIGEMNVTILKSAFRGCSSEVEYGGIYARCERFDLTQSCFHECSSQKGEGISIYANSAQDLSMNLSTFSVIPKTNKGSFHVLMRNSNPISDDCNFSWNTNGDYGIGISNLGNNLELFHNYFYFNQGDMVIKCGSCFIQSCYFVNCSTNSTILSRNGSVVISSSFFFNIGFLSRGQQNIIIEYCTINSNEFQVEGEKIEISNYFVNSSEKIVQPTHVETFLCWELLDRDVPFRFSVSFYGIVGIFCALFVFYFIMRCHLTRVRAKIEKGSATPDSWKELSSDETPSIPPPQETNENEKEDDLVKVD